MTQNGSKLDLELLDEMADLGIEDLRELIDEYMEQANEVMQNVYRAIDAGNADEVAGLAHRLAGSCGVCGATSAMNTLRMLERSGCQANWPAITKQFEQSIQEIQSSGELLGNYLRERNQRLRTTFVPPQMLQVSHS
jgi:HPt (histidine-containing phosphotransfer) domain-containing protein